jgi:hypothetical protein
MSNKLVAALAMVCAAYGLGCVIESDESSLSEATGEAVDQSEQAILNGNTGFAKRASFSTVADYGPGTPAEGCTAVAISTKWMATAAHCVYDSAGDLYPRVFVNGAGEVANVHVHPSFIPYAASGANFPASVADVALLKLQYPLNEYSDDCSYAPDFCWRSSTGEPIPVGETSYGYLISNYNYGLEYPWWPQLVCDGTGASDANDGTTLNSNGLFNMSSVYYEGGVRYAIPTNAQGQRFTFGDSGGPCYFYVGAKNRHILASITSSVTLPSGIGHVTSASMFSSWINATIPQTDRVLIAPSNPGDRF